MHRILDDVLDEGEEIVRVERRPPRQELVKDHAETPEIRRVVVLLLLHELRRHVQGRALAT
eukprot:886456-Prorocentrum_lima.AAC.1